jgi:hypothetical protein
MSCKRCASGKVRDFDGELAIQYPGLKGLDIPHVFVNPKLIICLECGFTEFSMPETELRSLVDGRLPVVGTKEPPSATYLCLTQFNVNRARLAVAPLGKARFGGLDQLWPAFAVGFPPEFRDQNRACGEPTADF